jgi:hypothetical protein
MSLESNDIPEYKFKVEPDMSNALYLRIGDASFNRNSLQLAGVAEHFINGESPAKTSNNLPELSLLSSDSEKIARQHSIFDQGAMLQQAGEQKAHGGDFAAQSEQVGHGAAASESSSMAARLAMQRKLQQERQRSR